MFVNFNINNIGIPTTNMLDMNLFEMTSPMIGSAALVMTLFLGTLSIADSGSGVDSAWEQEKLEARKMLEKPHRTPASSARFVRWRFKRTTSAKKVIGTKKSCI
jgi:hypothetical protein